MLQAQLSPTPRLFSPMLPPGLAEPGAAPGEL